MSAYFVFTREKTTNPAEMAIYQASVEPTLASFDLTILAAYGTHEVLEGPPVEGVVVIQFPSSEAARSWYNSPAYVAVRAHRLKGAEYRCVLVEGV